LTWVVSCDLVSDSDAGQDNSAAVQEFSKSIQRSPSAGRGRRSTVQ